MLNQIIHDENIPGDWKEYLLVNCYNGKGDTFCRSLKLLDHVMKDESLIHLLVGINNMQFDGTTDVIYILLQTLEEDKLLRFG